MEFQQIIYQFVGDGLALNLRIALAWPPSSRRTSVTRIGAAATSVIPPLHAPGRRRRLPLVAVACIARVSVHHHLRALLELKKGQKRRGGGGEGGVEQTKLLHVFIYC